MLPFPPGAILRDVLNVFFVALVLVRFVIDRKKTYFPLVFTIFSWSAVILWVIAL
ncbi:O-antigen ligase domain-containing protein, partial [Salmonella enterica]|nr:O-antigen ligase domain-containing protein [Salmonella enterica]